MPGSVQSMQFKRARHLSCKKGKLEIVKVLEHLASQYDQVFELRFLNQEVFYI